MPVAVSTPALPPALDPRRKRWTREEFEALAAAGLLQDQKLELIEGELISTMGKHRPHTNALILMQRWLVATFGALFVNPETPIDVAPQDNPASEPQPDLIVLGRSSLEFQTANPQASEVRLLVEISDSTLAFDLTRKAALYARAGIADYWVLDVAGRRLIVHRQPEGGRYLQVIAYAEHEAVAPLAAPASPFTPSQAFHA